MQEETSLMKPLTPEQLSALCQDMPGETGYQKTYLPKIGILPKNKTEGEGLEQKVVQLMGTFYLPKKEGEEYSEEFITDKTLEVVVLYYRYFLSFWDNSSGKSIKSFSYDDPKEQIILRSEGKIIAKGTRDELQANKMFPSKTDANGRKQFSLKECRELIVLWKGKVYSMPINFMSSIAFSKYNKLLPKPLSSIITSISVKKVEKGNIWVETVFTQLRDVNSEEANEVISLRTEIIEGIKDEKEYYGSAPKPVEGGLEPLKLDAPEDFDPFEPGNKL